MDALCSAVSCRMIYRVLPDNIYTYTRIHRNSELNSLLLLNMKQVGRNTENTCNRSCSPLESSCGICVSLQSTWPKMAGEIFKLSTLLLLLFYILPYVSKDSTHVDPALDSQFLNDDNLSACSLSLPSFQLFHMSTSILWNQRRQKEVKLKQSFLLKVSCSQTKKEWCEILHVEETNQTEYRF